MNANNITLLMILINIVIWEYVITTKLITIISLLEVMQ